MLSKHHLGWLVNSLHLVQAKWYHIELQLGIHCGDLDVIEKNSNSDTNKALTEMLKIWLAGKTETSIEELSKALKTDSVGEFKLGEEILSKSRELNWLKRLS